MRKPGRKKIATNGWEEDKTSTGDAGTAHALGKSHLDYDANAAGSMIVEHNASENSYGLPSQKKNLRFTDAYVRRSGRYKSYVFSAGTQGAKSTVGCIDLVESEKKRALHSQEGKMPVFAENNVEKRPQVQEADGVSNTNLSNLEEKIDYLLNAVAEFKSQMPRRSNESHSGEPNYKDLYDDAERKIEALMSENFELVKKLEYARGELSAYRAVTKESMSTWKEATEAIIGLLPQPAHPLTDDLKENNHSKTNPVTALTDDPKENTSKRRKG